jgi:hypothetical protein
MIVTNELESMRKEEIVERKEETPGLSPPANYTDRTAAACRRS